MPTSSRYGPIGRLGNVYAPSSSVKTDRVYPVSVCVSFTSAPGRRAPEESFTVPAIWDVAMDWAPTGTIDTNTTSEKKQKSAKAFFIAVSLRYGRISSGQLTSD